MKFIKVTKIIDPYEIKVGYYGGLYNSQVFVPAGSSGSSQSSFLGGIGSILGLGQQNTQSQQNMAQNQQSQQNMAQNQQSQLAQQQIYNNPVPIPKPIETQTCYLCVNSINQMIENPTSTILFLRDKEQVYVKETPEQIMKMIHDQEFNNKMDDLLSE